MRFHVLKVFPANDLNGTIVLHPIAGGEGPGRKIQRNSEMPIYGFPEDPRDDNSCAVSKVSNGKSRFVVRPPEDGHLENCAPFFASDPGYFRVIPKEPS